MCGCVWACALIVKVVPVQPDRVGAERRQAQPVRDRPGDRHAIAALASTVMSAFADLGAEQQVRGGRCDILAVGRVS